MVAHLCEYTKKQLNVTSKGWILWYVNDISITLLLKKNKTDTSPTLVEFMALLERDDHQRVRQLQNSKRGSALQRKAVDTGKAARLPWGRGDLPSESEAW